MKKLVFLFCLTLFLHSEVTVAQVWEPVGDPSGVSAAGAGRQTLICDSNDDLIVGYYDTSVAKGSVKKYDALSQSWSYVGGEPGISNGTTLYNSLSVDSQGTIYFFNQAGWPDSGHEARMCENGEWTQLPNVTNAGINFNTSAFSPDDVLFAVNSENDGTVKKWVDGAWEQVGSTGFTGGIPYFLDMVVGSNDKIYVSFNNNGYVHVYENNTDATSADAWQPVGGTTTLAPSPSTEDYNSSLAIDSQNNLYVAYVSDAAGGFKLNTKKFDGTTWSQVGDENFTEFRVKHTSIAIGADDIVYVAVSNWENINLLRNYVMAYDETEGVWEQAGTGFASEDQGVFNSLTVDSFGNLFMSFSDSGLGKLSVKRLNLNIIAAASIEISTEGDIPAEIDEDNGTLQLNALVLPVQASQDVVWSMETGGTFATVDENGVVTAIASDAVVTVKAEAAENSSIFSTIEINITNQDSDIDADEVIVETAGGGYPDISYADIFALGNTLQLTSAVFPIEADQNVAWTVEEGGDTISIDENGLATALEEGFAIVRATHIDGLVYEEIRVNVWENGCSQGTAINNNGFGDSNITGGAGFGVTDDFIVEEGMRFEVTKLRLRLRTQDVAVASVTLDFLEDNNGRPGEVLQTIENIIPTSQTFIHDHNPIGKEYDVELDLPESLILNQGTYWISPQATAADGSDVAWALAQNEVGSSVHILNVNHGWIGFGLDGLAGSYEITGNCVEMPVIISTVSGEDAVILVGESLALQAEVNTTGNTEVVWTVESGSEYISIDNETATATGIGVGIATVRAALVEDLSAYHEMHVTVLDPNGCDQGVVSNGLENAYVFSGVRLAVDIIVEEGSQFTIQSVVPETAGYATNFEFIFYEDDNGFPGNEITTVNGEIVNDWITGLNFDLPFHRYTVALDNEVTLPPGNYWMEIVCDAVAWESTSAQTFGQPGVFDDGTGWVYTSNGSDYVYSLRGVCEEYLSTPQVESFQLSYFPNPVKETLSFYSTIKIDHVKVYDIRGREMLSKTINNTSGQIDFSGLSSGLYMVKALSGQKSETFKIIKH